MSGEPEGAIAVLVVDDHQVLADSLVRVLSAETDIHPVGVAPDLARARAMVVHHRPDVVLLDHTLPDGEGADAVRPLLEANPGMAVVMLTASTSDRVLGAAMEAGAAGFISKTSGLSELVTAVRAAARGDAVVSPQLLSRLLVRMRREAQGVGHDLTDREREILQLLSKGLTNVAISGQLFLSVHTVRNHIANLSAKLGAHSKLEALAIAVREGLVEPPR
ncbi:response regulator transcription factor [Nocardioides bigeumensis]|jgi:DNA-binding NarL/FixJ family response regulator|uniref:Response regulator transcription factor n=1 Tax=Nocardioides bigeumensis TaxID=433657 RepID=A0ABN2YNQ2_9ACTN